MMLGDLLSWEKSGGLARRFKDHPMGVRRLIDPITNRSMAFGNDLIFENWLLHRFDQQVAELEHSPTPIVGIGLNGARVKAVAHLCLTRKDGRRELHLVFASKAPAGQQRALTSIAKLLGGELVLRSRAAIRQDVVATGNLRYLRQVMTMWSSQGQEIDESVKEQVASAGCLVRGQVIRALQQYEPGLIDSRLGHMHCRGDLVVHFNGSGYGDGTVISRSL